MWTPCKCNCGTDCVSGLVRGECVPWSAAVPIFIELWKPLTRWVSLRLSQLIMEQGELPYYETVTMFFSASYKEPHEECLTLSGAVTCTKLQVCIEQSPPSCGEMFYLWLSSPSSSCPISQDNLCPLGYLEVFKEKLFYIWPTFYALGILEHARFYSRRERERGVSILITLSSRGLHCIQYLFCKSTRKKIYWYNIALYFR